MTVPEGGPPGPPGPPGGQAPAESTHYTQSVTTVWALPLFLYLSLLYGFNAYKLVFSVANLAKGALGGGVLSAHGAYMRSGFVAALFLNVGFGLYLGFCFYILAKSSQIMCRRCQVPQMSYPDLAEATFALHSNKKFHRFASCFRYFIDFVTCMNLFGSCACYQLIVGKTLKQLFEKTHESAVAGLNGQSVGRGPYVTVFFETSPFTIGAMPVIWRDGKDKDALEEENLQELTIGMPHLRVYVAAMIIPTICISLITQMKILAPFSIMGNAFVALAIFTTIYYAFTLNPTFTGLVPITDFRNQLLYVGMAVFSMSCAGVVIPVENNLNEPRRMKYVMIIGYCIIITSVFLCGFFGYTAFLDTCRSPITMNFPLDTYPIILKACVAVMIYITHAVNFYMPFNCVFHYIKKRIKDQSKHFMWELICRAAIVTIIACMAIAFPDIDAIISFLGCFCITNMAFICPNSIYLIVCWDRPGMGPYKWRIWRAAVFIFIGVFVLIVGTWVAFMELLDTFKKNLG